MAAILRDAPALLRLSPAAEPIRAIIDTCLAKDPNHRYQRAEDVKLALLAIAVGAASPTKSGRMVAQTAVQRPPLLERTPRESAFVGRERERGRLAGAWALAKAGRRQLCLMAGEPGIGKTRLSLEFARQCADENAIVLVGRCDEEALVPYQPFVEALGWYARTAPEQALRAAIPATSGADLAAFAPEFLARLPNLPEPTPMNAAGQRYRLFESVNGLLSTISAGVPVLVFIDDLHWADKPTLSMLRHVIRGSEPAALLLIGTYRESEVGAGHPLGELLADLRPESAVTRVVVAGLEAGEVGALISALSAANVPSSLARQVVESTGGNPFFVSEMARHLNETGLAGGLPEGIREVILRRVSRLSEPCVRALTLAAVVGREFDLDVLEAVADLSENDLLDAIDEARQAQLIDEAAGKPGRYSFHHALIRNALYDGMASTRRVRIHRRVAEALEKVSAHLAEPPLADLAYHFTQAASAVVAQRAADYAIRAADRMAAALAHEEAARFYDYALQALDSMPAGPDIERQRVVIHRRRGRAFSNLGQWGNQRAALDQALNHLQRVSLRVTSRRQNLQMAAKGREHRKGASGAKCQDQNQLATDRKESQTAEKQVCGIPASQPQSRRNSKFLHGNEAKAAMKVDPSPRHKQRLGHIQQQPCERGRTVHQQQRRGRRESPGLIDERRCEPREAQKNDEDPEADVKPLPGPNLTSGHVGRHQDHCFVCHGAVPPERPAIRRSDRSADAASACWIAAGGV
jgi:predicted ATPase